MEILKKIAKKQNSLRASAPVTIVFLGDSVTQGCFECYYKNDTEIETVFERKNAYSTHLGEILSMLYPKAQVNIINSGISGDDTPGGLARLERDVLSYHPDLVVVSFGLNDLVMNREAGLQKYADTLREIFTRCKDAGCECIYLTECVMNDKVSCHIKDEKMIALAERLMDVQKKNLTGLYFEKGKEVAKECGVWVCDPYSTWAAMAANGVDTTDLLANKINHPCREFHYYIAMKLVETMLGI